MTKRLALLAALAAATPTGAAVSPPLTAQFERASAIDGQAVAIAGRVTVVNFWATWCVPCRAEMPLLDAYYRRHRDEGLTVIGVAMDAGSPVNRLRAATTAFVLPIVPVARVRMPRGDTPNGIPVTRVYDRQGRLRFDSAVSGKGTIDAATLDRVVAPLLRER